MATSHSPGGSVAAAHPTLVKIGRVGWLAKGVVLVVAGLLALSVVGKSFGWDHTTGNSKEPNPTGAIKEIAGSRGGTILLIALAIGLFLYAAWRLAMVLVPGRTDFKAMVKRIGYFISAIMYVTFGITAISLARSPEAKSDGDSSASDITTWIMRNDVGRWTVGIIGIIIAATGVYRFITCMKVDVAEEIEMGGLSPTRARWTRRLGSIGELGRGLALCLIGLSLIRASAIVNVAEATGLDGALRKLATESWGTLVVAGIGLGLVASGLFCIVTFTRRRLQTP